ncbi:MAG: trypsin-like peptidase domain-containing protein, partial [Dolichospermum sp.]
MRRFFTILIFSILLALLPVIAHALSYDQVSQIAKDTVVLIDGCTSGSGVIYERKGNVYSILTAKHVVSQPNGCFVITPDKVRQRINPNIIPVSGIDLAVVQFNSDENYKLAEFGNSVALTPGKTVYVA